MTVLTPFDIISHPRRLPFTIRFLDRIELI